jgi:hypothetical protein
MRYFLMLGLLLMFSITAFAQAEDSGTGHDQDSPVQAGFAIITPLPATTSGGSMTVFATFGYKRDGETQPAGILPPGLTTSAVVFVSSSGRLSRNLGVAMVNPDSANADVTMTLLDQNGTQLATKLIHVAGHHQIAQLVTELFTGSIPPDVTGTLYITSTNPVAIMGLRFRGANFSTLPVTILIASPGALPSPSAGVGGAGAVLLPQFVTGGGWATEIVIANTGTAAMSVRLDLFKSDGTPLVATLNGTTASTFTNLTIPAGGVITIAPRDHDGNDDF